MAVEIKEIVIKAIISDVQNLDQKNVSENISWNKEALIQECVNKTLKVLEKKKRR